MFLNAEIKNSLINNTDKDQNGITSYLHNQIKGIIIKTLSADKVFIIIPFIWLCKYEVIPFWSLSVLLIREFLISAFRNTKENGLPALRIGKYKTLLQFISLIILFSNFNNFQIQNIGMIFYWISIALTIVSLFSYLRIK